jgi:superfamily II DNA/RNA helicase
MLDMGFKDEISNILKRLPAQRQTLLFSATFNDEVFKLSKRLLNDPLLIEVDSRNSTASQVEQIVYNVDADRKRELTSYLIGSKNWQQVLIFTRTKQTADALVKEMKKDGINTQAIHGDKAQGMREKALADFKSGTVRALVATDIAARGLDIIDLPVVINYELPFNAEDYIHRIGRTGRAGNQGLAISLMSYGEEWLLEEIETILETRLGQQWLAGYEPDLSKPRVNLSSSSKSGGRNAEKQRAKRRVMGSKSKNPKRR